MNSLKESCVSTEDTFRIIESQQQSSSVAALVSRLQIGSIGDGDKNGNKSNKDDKDDDKPNAIFPWLPKITDLCRATVGTQSIKSLESMLTIFLHNVTPSVKECNLKPIRAGKLRTLMNEILVYFHLLYQDIKELIDNTLYLEKMTELMAMYIDLEIKASRRRKEPIKRVISRLASALNVFLDQNDSHILDAIMRAKLIAAQDRDICCPILEKLLTRKRVYNLHDTLYVRYLLVFKLWKKIVLDQNKRKDINKLAIALLPPPANFADRYKRFNNVLPRMPNNKNITQFYMQAKINVKNACQSFMKISKDPLHPIPVNKPLFFDSRSPCTFSGKGNVFDGGVSRNLMNEIWSTFSEDNSATKKKKEKNSAGKKKKLGGQKVLPNKKKDKKVNSPSSDKFSESNSPADVAGLNEGKSVSSQDIIRDYSVKLPQFYERLVQAEASPSTVAPPNASLQYQKTFNLRKPQELSAAKRSLEKVSEIQSIPHTKSRYPCSLVPAYDDEVKPCAEDLNDSVDSPPTVQPAVERVQIILPKEELVEEIQVPIPPASVQKQFFHNQLAQVKIEKSPEEVMIVDEVQPANYGKIRPARFAKSDTFEIDKYASFVNAPPANSGIIKPVLYEPAQPPSFGTGKSELGKQLVLERSPEPQEDITMQIFKESDIQLGDQDLPYIEEEVIEPCRSNDFDDDDDEEDDDDVEMMTSVPGSSLNTMKSLAAEISNCVSYLNVTVTPPPQPPPTPKVESLPQLPMVISLPTHLPVPPSKTVTVSSPRLVVSAPPRPVVVSSPQRLTVVPPTMLLNVKSEPPQSMAALSYTLPLPIPQLQKQAVVTSPSPMVVTSPQKLMVTSSPKPTVVSSPSLPVMAQSRPAYSSYQPSMVPSPNTLALPPASSSPKCMMVSSPLKTTTLWSPYTGSAEVYSRVPTPTQQQPSSLALTPTQQHATSRVPTPTQQPTSRVTTPTQHPTSRVPTPTQQPTSRVTTPTQHPTSRVPTPTQSTSRVPTPTQQPISRSLTPTQQSTSRVPTPSQTQPLSRARTPAYPQPSLSQLQPLPVTRSPTKTYPAHSQRMQVLPNTSATRPEALSPQSPQSFVRAQTRTPPQSVAVPQSFPSQQTLPQPMTPEPPTICRTQIPTHIQSPQQVQTVPSQPHFITQPLTVLPQSHATLRAQAFARTQVAVPPLVINPQQPSLASHSVAHYQTMTSNLTMTTHQTMPPLAEIPPQIIPRQQTMTRPHSITPPKTPPLVTTQHQSMGPPPPPKFVSAHQFLEPNPRDPLNIHDITAIQVDGFVNCDGFKFPNDSLSFGMADDFTSYYNPFSGYNDDLFNDDILDYLNGGMQEFSQHCLIDPAVIERRPDEMFKEQSPTVINPMELNTTRAAHNMLSVKPPSDSFPVTNNSNWQFTDSLGIPSSMPFMVDDDEPQHSAGRGFTSQFSAVQEYSTNSQLPVANSVPTHTRNNQKLSETCDMDAVINSYENAQVVSSFHSSFPIEESFNGHRTPQIIANSHVPKSPMSNQPTKPQGKPGAHQRSSVVSPRKRSARPSLQEHQTIVECNVQLSQMPEERSVCISKPSTQGGMLSNNLSMCYKPAFNLYNLAPPCAVPKIPTCHCRDCYNKVRQHYDQYLFYKYQLALQASNRYRQPPVVYQYSPPIIEQVPPAEPPDSNEEIRKIIEEYEDTLTKEKKKTGNTDLDDEKTDSNESDISVNTSLPPKKRHKNITLPTMSAVPNVTPITSAKPSVSKGEDLPSKIQCSSSFPSYPTRPMMSIAELEEEKIKIQNSEMEKAKKREEIVARYKKPEKVDFASLKATPRVEVQPVSRETVKANPVPRSYPAPTRATSGNVNFAGSTESSGRTFKTPGELKEHIPRDHFCHYRSASHIDAPYIDQYGRIRYPPSLSESMSQKKSMIVDRLSYVEEPKPRINILDLSVASDEITKDKGGNSKRKIKDNSNAGTRSSSRKNQTVIKKVGPAEGSDSKRRRKEVSR